MIITHHGTNTKAVSPDVYNNLERVPMNTYQYVGQITQVWSWENGEALVYGNPRTNGIYDFWVSMKVDGELYLVQANGLAAAIYQVLGYEGPMTITTPQEVE